MQKQNDALAQFTALRSALAVEREAIQKRLEQIDAALSGGAVPLARSAVPVREVKQRQTSPRPAKRPGNKMSVREAITQATAKKPLSIHEIVEAVQKNGYKFSSSNPVNSVGAFLYSENGKKHFKRLDGKFQGK